MNREHLAMIQDALTAEAQALLTRGDDDSRNRREELLQLASRLTLRDGVITLAEPLREPAIIV